MSAGGPSGHHDAASIAAEIRQLRGQKVQPLMNFGDDLVECRIRRQRIAKQRDVDAMRDRALGKQREDLLGARLPVAAMDEHQRRAFFASLDEIDAIALARTVSEVEMVGISRTLLRRAPLPAGDDLGASGHCNAVVETFVTVFLAHPAPIGRVERRTHAQISGLGLSSVFPLCRKMFYTAT